MSIDVRVYEEPNQDAIEELGTLDLDEGELAFGVSVDAEHADLEGEVYTGVVLKDPSDVCLGLDFNLNDAGGFESGALVLSADDCEGDEVALKDLDSIKFVGCDEVESLPGGLRVLRFDGGSFVIAVPFQGANVEFSLNSDSVSVEGSTFQVTEWAHRRSDDASQSFFDSAGE